jgi:hypothetical protein
MVKIFEIQQGTKRCFTLIETELLLVDLRPFKSDGSITNALT